MIDKSKYFLMILMIFMQNNGVIMKQIPCEFNRLCYCSDFQYQLKEITCIGVALTKLPSFPPLYFYRIRIRASPDIRVLKNDCFSNVTVSSFTLSGTKLSLIEAFAFDSVKQTLTTLELSHGNLRDFPRVPLSRLENLQWLNLKGNKIESVNGRDFKDLISLRSVFLSDNSLSMIHDQTFIDLPNIEYLDLDSNMITRIEGTPFPLSLKSLSLENCLLQSVPSEAISNLKNLKSLRLSSNVIRYLSHVRLPSVNLELLDLSHNLIASFSDNVFTIEEKYNPDNPLIAESVDPRERLISGNNVNISYSLRIKDLHLDFNFIQSLPSEAFKHISVERLSLSNNRITSLAEDAFVGPLQTQLKVLDLNYNLMDTYPEALSCLRGLKQLLLKNNRLRFVRETAFSNHHSLEVLDLSRNLLSAVPTKALMGVVHLLRLNLHYNLITTISEDDIGEWSVSLISLSLAKNNIKTIAAGAFKYATNLRELRLAANDIVYINPDVFVPLTKLELLELSALNFANSNNLIQSDICCLSSLKWIQLDYSKLSNLQELSLHTLPSLVHCDFEGNQINFIENNTFNHLSNLSTIILSRNHIRIIKSLTFTQLKQLENIALYHNQLEKIETKAFNNLPKLKNLMLSQNGIRVIESGAFYNLSNAASSLTILLNDNKLNCFSLDMFTEMDENTADTMYINVSHNEISELRVSSIVEPLNEISNSTGGDHYRFKQTLNVRVFDLSFNRISLLPREFMDTICSHMHAFHLEHNVLTHIPSESLHSCVHLQILILDHNFISGNTTRFANQSCCSNLQILSLRHNKITTLFKLSHLFLGMRNLRILDISNNFITHLSENIFRGTKLEILRLSHNKLHQSAVNQRMPQCFSAKETFVHLDLSDNSIGNVPFHVISCENLIELNLANNKIEEISEHSFSTLTHLLELDLSHNPINRIDSKCFYKSMPNLNILKLNNISMVNVPILALPHLVYLDLSENLIASVASSSFAKTRKLKYLDLSKNLLSDVPRHLWRYMTELQYLNLAHNPIDILDTSSLVDLKRLNHLDIRGLSLQYIDTRLLYNQRHLLTLKTSTYPNVRSFRLHDLLSKSISLKSALIDVQESTLSHQIQWAFGTKLKELIITGENLINILPDAFLGFHQMHDLTLRVTNTNVTNLPNGMLRYLSGIKYMTIDLRKNKLRTIKPEVLLTPLNSVMDSEEWNFHQVNLAGGIFLDDNPLKCDCSLLWISDWMRRWISDMRILNIEAAVQAHTLARQSACTVHNNNGSMGSYRMKKIKRIPLLDLRSYGVTCESSANINILNTLIFIIIITRLIMKLLENFI